MFFQQYYEPRLAQYSYLIGCQATGEALVVDPLRDAARYVHLAQQQGLRITRVTETHIHADFLSGARALADMTGAELLLSDEGGPGGQYAFPHHGLHDGDSFSVGNIQVQALHTPGHTPEHLSFIITDAAAGDVPGMILTGDFVFIGDVGRPDLLRLVSDAPDVEKIMARRMFASLQKFRALPDHLALWPGHGAGSACGKALGAAPASTVGYEKRTNWALQEQDEEAFITRLLADQPMAPRYFGAMKRLNRSGESWQDSAARPAPLSVQQLETWIDQGVLLVDARDKLAFAAGHIPGSINLPGDALFSAWAGWLLDSDDRFVLIAPQSTVSDLVTSLHRIGLDGVVGYFADVHYWTKMGHSLAELPQMSARELAKALAEKTAIAIDVREPFELRGGFIPGAIAVPGGRLARAQSQPHTERRLVLYCGRGDRSVIMASYLRHLGFENVTTLREGLNGWRAAGLEIATADSPSDFEQVDVEEAQRRFSELGQALIDVREPEEYQQGHVPGSLNFPLDDFVDEEVIETLRAKGALLLICNTGNRSAMAADWLLEEGLTNITNVSGGVVAWQLHHLPWQK